MKNKVLTISIATYYMERFIQQTLESICVEEIIDRLEIFVIDDGGTDDTLKISQTSADRYPASVFPVHKENGGYGSTVNYSLAHASGTYFRLLDGDGWFDSEGLVRLVKRWKTPILISSSPITEPAPIRIIYPFITNTQQKEAA